MTKQLEGMTSEELGRLFPIILNEHNPEWKGLYLSESNIIMKAVGKDNIVRINHYGSTSVPGLYAKPTIDILLEIKNDADTDKLILIMKDIGYYYSYQPDNPPPYMMFMKGYTNKGFKGQAYHVHVRYGGDWDELYFRNYLIKHKDISDEYGKLKFHLKKQYEFDRDGYTAAKSEFIKKITALARQESEKDFNKWKED